MSAAVLHISEATYVMHFMSFTDIMAPALRGISLAVISFMLALMVATGDGQFHSASLERRLGPLNVGDNSEVERIVRDWKTTFDTSRTLPRPGEGPGLLGRQLTPDTTPDTTLDTTPDTTPDTTCDIERKDKYCPTDPEA